MNWEIILIIGLLIAIVVLIFTKFKVPKKDLFKLSILKGKVIHFATPHRLELILLFLYAVLFLWWDVLQNKVLDLGVDYRVTWFGNVTSTALDLAIVILILFHIVLMALFLLSLKSKHTHRVYDIIIGTIAFFGVAIVLTGFVNSIYSDTIRFLFINMKSISFYHIGVFAEMMCGLYWGLTK